MSAPIIVPGAVAITLITAYSGALEISDLPGGGLRLVPGQTFDLGTIYTQKQILDSVELKRQLILGNLTQASGTVVPSLEPTHNT